MTENKQQVKMSENKQPVKMSKQTYNIQLANRRKFVNGEYFVIINNEWRKVILV